MLLDTKDYIKKIGTILKHKTKFQLKKSNAKVKNVKKFQGFQVSKEKYHVCINLLYQRFLTWDTFVYLKGYIFCTVTAN